MNLSPVEKFRNRVEDQLAASLPRRRHGARAAMGCRRNPAGRTRGMEKAAALDHLCNVLLSSCIDPKTMSARCENRAAIRYGMPMRFAPRAAANVRW